MKIIQITPSYKPAYIYGGPIFSVSKLCETLQLAQPKNIEIEVLTTTANGLEELSVTSGKAIEVDGIWVTYFKRLTKDHSHFSPALLWALHRKIKETRVKSQDSELPTSDSKLQTPDSKLTIHIHSWWNLVTVLSVCICLLNGIKPILSPRGMLSNYSRNSGQSLFKRLFHQFIGKRLLQKVHFHVTSTSEAQEIQLLFPKVAITDIPNLITLPEGTEQKTNQKNTLFKVLFLSRVDPKKGIELLIESLKLLPPNIILSIAGTGEDLYIKNLHTLCTNLHVEQQVRWLGKIEPNEKAIVYQSHDLFVLPSYNENFANVVIEALALGVPVVISDQVGTADFVQKYDLGWVCKPCANDLRNVIEQAMADVEKRQRIHTTASQIVQKEFASKVLVQKYLSMYQNL